MQTQYSVCKESGAAGSTICYCKIWQPYQINRIKIDKTVLPLAEFVPSFLKCKGLVCCTTSKRWKGETWSDCCAEHWLNSHLNMKLTFTSCDYRVDNEWCEDIGISMCSLSLFFCCQLWKGLGFLFLLMKPDTDAIINCLSSRPNLRSASGHWGHLKGLSFSIITYKISPNLHPLYIYKKVLRLIDPRWCCDSLLGQTGAMVAEMHLEGRGVRWTR